jgi:tRNA nucleotidyltransferase (CCA-adding enzyme)
MNCWGTPAHDFDIEVFGTDYETLRRVLASFGPTDVVGKSFGVIKARLNGQEYDFSYPAGDQDWIWPPRIRDGAGSIAELRRGGPPRRDFTINAIGYDPITQELIDPHGGQRDLEHRWLRHVGPAFAEDPLRVMRGFQLASRFDLRMAPETIDLCRKMVDTFPELPRERIWHEWEKWARLSVVPSRGPKSWRRRVG